MVAKKYRNRSWKKFGTKQVSESVSEIFGIEISRSGDFPTRPFQTIYIFYILKGNLSLYIYLTISCQNFDVGLGLEISLVPFPEFLIFLDGIGTGKVLEEVSEKFSSKKSWNWS